MRVSAGWNTDFGKVKFSVDVGEDDLGRLLMQGGLPIEARESLTMGEAYRICYCSAEMLARDALIRFDPGQEDRLREEMSTLSAERREVLEGVKARWQPSER